MHDRLRRVIVAVAIAGIALPACTSDAPHDGRLPVVVDTDMGQDDMMALLYLLQRPDVSVEAITVSGTGLAHCDDGVRIALSLLEVAGAPPTPVACGPEEPLPNSYPFAGAFPTAWRVATDDAYGIELPASDRTPSGLPAPELLVHAVQEADAPVSLLTLGPLTNVALALRADPSIAEELSTVTIMGGAVDVPGNTIRTAASEYNAWVDPTALREVLGSGAPVTLVPLDATNEVPVTPFFAAALQEYHRTPASETVAALFEAQPYLVEGSYSFWDPLAAVALVHPNVLSTHERRIAVLEGDKLVQGQTVEDPNGDAVLVAEGADAEAFETEFLDTLNGGGVVTTTRPETIVTVSVGGDGSCAWDAPDAIAPGVLAIEVTNPTDVPAQVVVVAIAGRHGRADLVVAAEHVEAGAEPPAWVRPVAFADASPGVDGLSPWDAAAGRHFLVCATGTREAPSYFVGDEITVAAA